MSLLKLTLEVLCMVVALISRLFTLYVTRIASLTASFYHAFLGTM